MKTTTIDGLLANLSSDKPDVKYPSAKKLIEIAEKNPELLIPHLKFFVDLLNCENNILKWTAIDVVGYLSCIGRVNQVDRAMKYLVNFLRGGKLIAANHAIAALSHIALERSKLQNEITNELLKCESYKYETDECHNIVMGKVILALSSYLKSPDIDARVIEFLKRQTSNTRIMQRRKRLKKFLACFNRKEKHLSRTPMTQKKIFR